MFNKILASLIIITSCASAYKFDDVNNINSANTYDTQIAFSNWEDIKKEYIKVSQKDIFESQQAQINYLEKAQEKTLTSKMYKLSLVAGDFAIQMWNDPIIRTTIILPTAFYFGNIIIGQKLTSEFGITLYKCLKEYLKCKYGTIQQLEEIRNTKAEETYDNIEKEQNNQVQDIQNKKNNSANDYWHKMSKNYFNRNDYVNYSIKVQQEQLKQLEKERNKGFFSRAWTGIKKVASSVKNGVVNTVKSAWKDNLFKNKVVLPIANLFGKYITNTTVGKVVTNFAGPTITKNIGNYFKEKILGIKQ